MADDNSSKRLTRFPGDSLSSSLQRHRQIEPEKKRMTRFPGGTPLLALEMDAARNRYTEQLGNLQRYVPLEASKQTSDPEVSPEVEKPTAVSEIAFLHVRREDPWQTYILVKEIGRTGKTKVARTRHIPVTMATIKEIKTTRSNTLSSYRHNNLAEITQFFEYNGAEFIVSEYIQVSLKQIVAIPLDLEEYHIAVICRQVSLFY